MRRNDDIGIHERGNRMKLKKVFFDLDGTLTDSMPGITKVVYQKHQFSPVGNGSIKRCKVTAETVEAVERALSGEDLTDGALYFMNRRASSRKNASWFDRHLEFLFKHGNHEFFR